jgi:hypothetical protein
MKTVPAEEPGDILKPKQAGSVLKVHAAEWTYLLCSELYPPCLLASRTGSAQSFAVGYGLPHMT